MFAIPVDDNFLDFFVLAARGGVFVFLKLCDSVHFLVALSFFYFLHRWPFQKLL